MLRRVVSSFAVLCLAASPAVADILSFRLGYFSPRASGGLRSLWGAEFAQMSFDRKEFPTGHFGFSYEHGLTRHLSLEIVLDSYARRRAGHYLEWVGLSLAQGNFAFPSAYYPGVLVSGHSFGVSIMPLQLSAKILPLGRGNRIIPFIGGGIGANFWTARIRGERIDFSDERWVHIHPELGEVHVYPILEVDDRQDARISVGFQAFVGSMVTVAEQITLSVEFRYHAATGKFAKDSAFIGLEDFDLTGSAFTVGLNYWF
jgi:hypothetical protein